MEKLTTTEVVGGACEKPDSCVGKSHDTNGGWSRNDPDFHRRSEAKRDRLCLLSG